MHLARRSVRAFGTVPSTASDLTSANVAAVVVIASLAILEGVGVRITKLREQAGDQARRRTAAIDGSE